MIKQMKEANKKEGRKNQRTAGIHLRDSLQMLPSPNRLLPESVPWKKSSWMRSSPSSRKYPYIDFRPNREIGNEVLTVENLSKTIDGVKDS